MRTLSYPGVSPCSPANLSPFHPAQAALIPQRKAVHFSGSQTDVFETCFQKAKPALPSLRFGLSHWPSPKEWNIKRAKELRNSTKSEQTYFFRAIDYMSVAIPMLVELQQKLGEPLHIVIDGDYRGKDAASIMSLLQEETGESYGVLAKKFVITRRDVHKNNLKDGLPLNSEDESSFETLLMLNEEKFKPIIDKLKWDIHDPSFKKSLGICQQVDITDPTLPIPSPISNVRFTMQILHYLTLSQCLNYVRDLAKTQAVGSLLVLGANEAISDTLESNEVQTVKSLTQSDGETQRSMLPIHQELRELGYKPVIFKDLDVGLHPESELAKDRIAIYKKVRDVPVPKREPEIESLIHSQALKDHPEFAIRLSQQGFDVNARNPEDSQTLLHLAAKQGLLGVAKALVAANAKSSVTSVIKGKASLTSITQDKEVVPFDVLKKENKKNKEWSRLLKKAK